MATIGNPSAWDNASDIPVGDAKGQTFTAPWDFNRVEFLLATYGNGPQTVWIIIYAGGASGSTQVAFLETTATDNAWCAIDLTTPLAAGSYHATVVNRGTSLAVWTNSSDSTYTGGTATVGRGAGGSTQSGDRAFIVTEAGASTTPVEQTLPVSWNTAAVVASTGLSETWAINDPATEPTPGDIVFHRRSGVFSNSGSGTLSVFWPDLGDASALQAGDIVYALAIHNDSISFPGDWTLVGTSDIYSGIQRASLLWKRLTGAVSGSISVTTGNATAVQLFSFRGGRLGGDPFQQFVIATQTGAANSASAQLSGFSESNAFLVAFGSRNATSTISDALTFTGATGGTDTTIVSTAVNSNVSAAPLAWYRDADSATDPTAVLTYGSTTGNPTSALFVLGMIATAPVESSFATTYNVKKVVASTLTTSFKVKQTATSLPIAANWRVRTSVAASSLAESWVTAGNVGTSVVSSWKTFSNVTKSAPASWKVRTGVTRSAEASWRTLAKTPFPSGGTSWKVLPIQTPFILGYDGPATYAADTNVFPGIGQVFTTPARFTQIQVFVATYGAPGASATFKLYNSATGSTLVSGGTITKTFSDNSWVTLDFPGTIGQAAGTYRLTMEASGGASSAWWSNINNVFATGYASQGTSTMSGDRLFRVIGSTRVVGIGRPYSFVTYGFAHAELSETYNVEATSIKIDAGLSGSWRTRALATADSAQSWATQGNAVRVTSALPVSWNVKREVVSPAGASWNVQDGSQGPSSLVSTWRVQPYQTPFIWGYQGASTGSVDAATFIPSQVFTTPVGFNKIEAFVTTNVVGTTTATFTLYSGSTGNTIVSRQTITFSNNTWAGLSFTRQDAGTYRFEIDSPFNGRVGWYSNTGDVFPNSYATAGGGNPAGGDRLFRITGATRVVGIGRPYTYGVIGRVSSSMTTSYNTEASLVSVENTLDASWGVIGLATGILAQSWAVPRLVVHEMPASYYDLERLVVEPALSNNWQVLNPVGSSMGASTWKVTRSVEASSVEESWTVRAQTTRSVAESWRVRAQVASTTSASFKVFRPVAASKASSFNVLRTIAQTLTQSFRVRIPVGTSKATSYHVRRPVASTFTTTYNTTTAPAKVTSSVSASYRVRAAVTGSRSASWNVRVAVSKTTAMPGWKVYRPVSKTAPATTWHVRRGVAQTNGQTFRVRAQVTSGRAASWKVFNARTSSAASAWNVKVSVQSPKVASFRVLQQVRKPVQGSWNVRTTTQSPDRTWTWQVLRTAPNHIVSPAWRIRKLVTASTTNRWNLESNLSGQVNIVVEMANYRSTVNVPRNRVVTEVPAIRFSTEVSGGDHAVPVAANE